MAGTVILWSHALAALLFAGLAFAQLRGRADSLPRVAFLVALGTSALWALAMAGIGHADIVTRVAESCRNIAWLVFMFALLRRDPLASANRAVATIYGVVIAVALAGIVLTVIQVDYVEPGTGPVTVRILLRMMVAVGALVLVHHLYSVVAPAARGGIRLAVAALAAMWSADLILYATCYASAEWPAEMFTARGFVAAAIVPLLAVAVHRNGDWSLNISRTMTWQTLTLVALMAYAVATFVVISVIDAFGGGYARVVQTAFVFGSAAALLTLLSSPMVKAWLRVMIAKHLFRHRYDYRAEWTRFTGTLGAPGEGAPPLEERIVKAVADVTDSPAGLLLAAETDNALSLAASWRWSAPAPTAIAGEALAAYLIESGRIVELDQVRSGSANGAELAAAPQWLVDLPSAWAIVPLIHLNELMGAIVLARPPIDRSLDWEDFDLLRIAGRQVASYLAEARAHEALADARQFDEFNRRFAFILHDVKNLVSQLSLVARNAERHADNPAFRADMVATLNDSAGRMNDLLARLSQHHSGRADDPVATELLPLVERVARRSAVHRVTVTGARDAVAMADPVRLEQALGHLIQNAVEASPSDATVTIVVGRTSIEVIDQGVGMSAAFVRDRLFRPFVSTKNGGFGVGAFEARQLIQAMGGQISVASREGEGTRFTITMPPALGVAALERAA
jgi:putative PEP-CTERM system histidine kinase